jgi:hypothetical protein
MWIPTKIYEKIPHFWILSGLLIISFALYLGYEFTATFWYIALGTSCCLFGFTIISWRQRYREKLLDARTSTDNQMNRSSRLQPANHLARTNGTGLTEQ